MSASRLLTAAGALILVAGFAGQALAHAHLKTEEPAASASVAAPQTLTLHFTEELNLHFSGVTVTGPNHKQVALGKAELAPKDVATLIVPVTGTLVPGSYTVAWHALSTDGHKTQGSYRFTVK